HLRNSAVEQMCFSEPIQSQPDDVFVDPFTRVITKNAGHLFDARLTVAMIPNQNSCVIKAMRCLSIQIVDEDFVLQRFNHKPVCARLWQELLPVVTHLSLQDDACFVGGSKAINLL